MWKGVNHILRRKGRPADLLIEFEDSLLLIVDVVQLARNLGSKLKQFIDVEGVVVYLADTTRRMRTIMRSPVARLSVAAGVVAAVVLGLFKFISTGSNPGLGYASISGIPQGHMSRESLITNGPGMGAGQEYAHIQEG